MNAVTGITRKEASMARQRFAIGISWDDRGVEDADILVVYADSSGKAKREARKKWRMAIGAEWPHCRVSDVWIFSPKKLRPAWLRRVS